MYTLSYLCADAFEKISHFSNDSSLQNNDLKCFQQSLISFLETGTKEDAFSVYFCFCDIFHIFGTGYDNIKHLLQLLSDHEYHSGELLIKHRDHYSHSVYVFALGLAIFSNDKSYRENFCKFYGLSIEDAYTAFLKYWGLTALFHDIGYPFQLAHEQIKSYGREIWGDNKSNLYVSFGNLKEFLALSPEDTAKFDDIFKDAGSVESINDVLALGVNIRMGYDIQSMKDKLFSRVISQPDFMDHGYFGAVLLIKQFLQQPDFKWSVNVLDVLSAILLHNNFNKYDADGRHPVLPGEHPLAYLLILCDELQNWDRLPYGKQSKKDPLAWDVKLDISDRKIIIKYIFDSFKIENHDNIVRLNKSYAELLDNTFVAKIIGGEVNGKWYQGFISTDLILLTQSEEIKKVKKTKSFASDTGMINLYEFAVAIHASYSNLCKCSREALNTSFGDLPLEFKISNIEMAKSYMEKLEQINCFFSSRELDYPTVVDFNIDEFGEMTDDIDLLCRSEHVRWVKEKIRMGWKFGKKGVDFKTIEERNAKKVHNCLIPYDLLPEEDRKKDRLMINNIIPMLKIVGGNLHVYRFLHERKPRLTVAGVGHIRLTSDRDEIKKRVKEILKKLSQWNNITVRTSFAYGADQIIAECAAELDIPTEAILPLPYDDFFDYVRQNASQNSLPFTDKEESHLRLLLAQTTKCQSIPPGPGDIFEKTADYILDNSDKLIAVWDGVELPLTDVEGKPVNRGGTYDCICKAKTNGLSPEKDIFIVNCTSDRI